MRSCRSSDYPNPREGKVRVLMKLFCKVFPDPADAANELLLIRSANIQHQ
jgi:hypothetical protein